VQLFDRYTFVANGDHYDVDQTLSVVGYQHTFENHHGRTAIQVAGRVIGAYDTWYRRWLDVYDVPSLDVRATPGSVSYTITYAVNAEVFQYSTNNGAFTTVPASGFTVSRPGAGSNSTALTFKATKNNQTITNTIFVPAVDQDTVTPDLTVTQTAQNDTTTSFQATASNPQGGGAPTITVFFVNCTSSTGHTNGQTIASGTTVGVNRPSFSGGQATVRFLAAITSAGAEEISRTIPNQVYDPATDPENMVVNGGGQDGTVGSLATGWTLDSSNPLVVANDKAKFGDRSLKITNASLAVSASRQDFNVVDGATYEISAWVEMTSVTGGGVALQVSIVSGVTSFEIFDKICPTDPDPTTPTMKVGTGTAVFQFIRCLFRVNGTGVIRAYTILGYGATSTGDTWFDGLQLKRVARLAPNLRVWASEGTTSDTIYYEVDADAVLVYRTDNGGDSTPAASGFTVSRNTAGGAKKVLTFTATRAGQKKVCTIEVLPKVPASATDTTAVITSIYYVSTDYALDDLVIGWRYTGTLGSGQFDIQWLDQSGVTADLSAAPSHKAYDSVSSSPATYTHDFSGLYDLQSGAGPKRTFSYQIRVLNSNGDVVSTSGWISRIETAV
jgi:hypothetical protein